MFLHDSDLRDLKAVAAWNVHRHIVTNRINLNFEDKVALDDKM